MVTTRQSANAGAKASMPSINQTPSAVRSSPPRNSPFLPTPYERLALGLFPVLLVFGSVFSVISPETRAAHYDPVSQSHSQHPSVAPSYFARKSNIFNVFFVKRGWGWMTFGFFFFILTHPSGGGAVLEMTPKRLRAVLRWAAATGWWILVTQWCFGPPMIDRGFRWTGGKCELIERDVMEGSASVGELFTSVACKSAGGKWNGGHDISGHVFLLVLGTFFLFQETFWPLRRWVGTRVEERCIIMPDGALKSANVEADNAGGQGAGNVSLGAGGKTALAIMALNMWMLLMTAIYFHTWFEKLTGLLTAFVGVYLVYIVPRFVPVVRAVIGMPGI